jgi:hypothetical protein
MGVICITNGDKVRVKDGDSEVFIVSQAGDKKCWIGDSQGRGWYINYDRLELIDESDTCEFCGNHVDDCECSEDDEYGYSTQKNFD